MKFKDSSISWFKPIYFTALVLFSLLLVSNNKLYLLAFFLYGLGLFFVYRFSLLSSLFATLLLSLPFERGLRDWVVGVVPPGPQNWIPGYSFYVGLSIKFIFLAAVILILFLSIKKVKKIGGNIRSQWILVSFLFASLLSTLYAENINLALLGVARIAFFVGLYLVSARLFTDNDLKQHFSKLIVLFLLFFGLVGTWQFLNRQPIGLFLEDLGSSGIFGYLTTGGERLYRVSGLTGHPTFFGSFLSLLLPAGAGYILLNINRKGRKTSFYLSLTAVLLGGLALFATFSRSGWISLIIAALFFLWRAEKTKLRVIRFNIVAPAVLIIGIFITFLGPLFLSRFESFSDISNIGNLRGRVNLIKQSAAMIKKLPVFGVGLNHFTKVMAEQNLTLEERTFHYPVHNTFLLFFSEIGVVAGSLFLGFVGISLFKTWKTARKNWVNFGIWVGAFSFLINAQFHTLFSLDPTLDMFMVMLAYLALL